MQIKFVVKGTTLIIKIIGELDHHYSEYVRQKVDAQIMKSTIKNIIFDLSKLSFMDSSGIGVIIGRYKNIQNLKGKAAIVSTHSHINRILHATGILKIMNIYDDLDKAVNAFI